MSDFEDNPIFEPVTNDDLICRDCVYRINGKDVLVCEKFDPKPDRVIGEGVCEEYE